jgi:hypothetical protein
VNPVVPARWIWESLEASFGRRIGQLHFTSP